MGNQPVSAAGQVPTGSIGFTVVVVSEPQPPVHPESVGVVQPEGGGVGVHPEGAGDHPGGGGGDCHPGGGGPDCHPGGGGPDCHPGGGGPDCHPGGGGTLATDTLFVGCV